MLNETGLVSVFGAACSEPKTAHIVGVRKARQAQQDL